jgi:hypothetical protein
MAVAAARNVFQNLKTPQHHHYTAAPRRGLRTMATKLYVVYYSMYGHVEKLAHEIKDGASTVEGVETTLWQVISPHNLHSFVDQSIGLLCGTSQQLNNILMISMRKKIRCCSFVWNTTVDPTDKMLAVSQIRPSSRGHGRAFTHSPAGLNLGPLWYQTRAISLSHHPWGPD